MLAKNEKHKALGIDKKNALINAFFLIHHHEASKKILWEAEEEAVIRGQKRLLQQPRLLCYV